jgi:ribosome-associated translation inhibitor RaiA
MNGRIFNEVINTRRWSSIARVAVTIVGLDGPSKKCRIEVQLHPARKIIVEDADTNLSAAIERATSQIARSVERKLRRERELMN